MSSNDFFQHDNKCQVDNHKLTKVVTIANSLDKSLKGTYFIGQTPTLILNDNIAYGALFNPKNSGVNLFVNVFTITNFSDKPLTAKIWINSVPPSHGHESPLVTTTNTAICPAPISPVKIIYKMDSCPITTGVNAFDRVIPGQSTIVAEEDGKYIVPPNKFFIISLTSTAPGPIRVAIAFGWWISKIKGC